LRNKTTNLKSRIVASLGKNALKDLRAIDKADVIELRLDLVEGDPLRTLKDLKEATTLPIIATNRWNLEGGQFEGSERERALILLEASDFADYIDIELRAEFRDSLLEKISKPAIISYHNFICTPSNEELRLILGEISKTRAEIAKIAVTPKSLRDNLSILNFLIEADKPLCMIAMGNLGKHLRVISPYYGSVLTFGYVSQPTAPGQMSIFELNQAFELIF
jgi:3-dehydroquinate dehydratase I